jgi:LysM domain
MSARGSVRMAVSWSFWPALVLMAVTSKPESEMILTASSSDGQRRGLRPQWFHGAQDAAFRDAADGQLQRPFRAGHRQRQGSLYGGAGSRPLPGRGRVSWPHESRSRLGGLHRDGPRRLPCLAQSAGYVARRAAGHARGYTGHRYASGRPDAGGGSYYVVRPGDTLSAIAAEFGTSVHYLASANGIPDPDFISVGQKIYY